MKTFLNISSKTARLLAESIKESAYEHEFLLKNEASSFVKYLDLVGKKADNTFHEFKDIDFLKNVVVELRKYSDESASEYCNVVSEIMFTIETDYQAYYGLSEDNWGIKEKNVPEFNKLDYDNLIGNEITVLEHDNVFEFTGTIEDIKTDTDGSFYFTVSGADDYFIDVSIKDIEITKENISDYYEFMDEDFFDNHGHMIDNIFENRVNILMDVLSLSNDTINEYINAELHETYSNDWVVGLEVFGVKDALKPINEYIFNIKESNGYKNYISSKPLENFEDDSPKTEGLVTTNKESQKTLIKQLEKQGEIEFNQNGSTVTIWETEQGEENIRGEDYMNYMYNLYDTKEFNADGEDAVEYDGGLCTGTSKDAIEMAIDGIKMNLKEVSTPEFSQEDYDELIKNAKQKNSKTNLELK